MQNFWIILTVITVYCNIWTTVSNNALPDECLSERRYKSTTVAELHSTAHLTLRIAAKLASENFPVMKYNNNWIKPNQPDTFIWFDFYKIEPTPCDYNLSITVFNLTVYEYGDNEFHFLTGSNYSIHLIWRITPPGKFIFQFNVLEKPINNSISEYALICNVSWYPKSIAIKNKFSGEIIITVDNTVKQMERRELKGEFEEHECDDNTLYTCDVMDFKGNIYTKNLSYATCEKPKLCEKEHMNTKSLNATNGMSANITLCIIYEKKLEKKDFKLHFIPHQNLTSEFTINVEKNNTTNIYFVNIMLKDLSIKQSDTYQLKMNVASKANLSQVLLLKIYEKPKLCMETENNTVIETELHQDINVSICIESDRDILPNITFNKVVVNADNTARYKIHEVIKYEPNKFKFKIEIYNASQQKLEKYYFILTTDLGYKLVYVRYLNVTVSLKVCQGESTQKTIKTKLGSTAVAHICVISDTEKQYLGINGKTYTFGDINYTDISLDSPQHNRNVKYIQIYFRNVTSDVQYNVTIKPVANARLEFVILLHIQIDKVPDVVHCHSSSTKLNLYYFATLSSNLTVSFCLSSNISGMADTDKLNTTNNIVGASKPSDVQNVYSRINETNHHYRVDVKFLNITEVNFARYEFTAEFGSHISTHIFYLIQDEEAEVYIHNSSQDCAPKKKNEQFFFKVFGTLDQSLIINNKSYRIPTHDPNNIMVDRIWNNTSGTTVIKLQLVNNSNRAYTVKLLTSDKTITHKSKNYKDCAKDITMVCVDNVNTSGRLTICKSLRVKKDVGVLWNGKNISSETNQKLFYQLTETHGCDQWFQLSIVIVNAKHGDLNMSNVSVVSDGCQSRINFNISLSDERNGKIPRIKCSYKQNVRNYENCQVNSRDLQSEEVHRRQELSNNQNQLPDLTRDLCEVIREGQVRYSGHRDQATRGSERYVSDEGLVYVTIDHTSAPNSSLSSRSTQSNDSTVYAQLDFNKMKDRRLLIHKKSSKKKRKGSSLDNGTDGLAVKKSTIDLGVPGSKSSENQGNFSGHG
ncbi:hypothetical protein Btru_041075 [Bulinus truncatus]|nr:hypothetical protein Btru_041075 [Bulinus truncatus]